MSQSFGTITITNVLTDEGDHNVEVDFDGLTVFDIFAMLEMARLHAIEGALGPAE